MKNLTIARKLALIIGVTVLWGVGMSVLLLGHLQDLNDSYDALLNREVAEVDAARVVQLEFKKQVQEWKDILLRGGDPVKLAKYRDAFFATESAVSSDADKLAKSTSDPAAAGQLAAFSAAHKAMGEKYRLALEAFTASADRDPHPADKAVQGQDRAPTDLIDGVVESLEKRISKIKADQAVSVRAQRSRTILISVLVLAVVLVLATAIARGITRAQIDIIRGLEVMATGDMSQRLDDTRRDEMGRIVVALNAAMEAARIRQEEAAAEAMERERAQSEVLRAGFEKVLRSIVAARAGDLTTEIILDSGVEGVVREVATTMGGLLENLRGRIATIDGHAGQLSAASEELSATAQQMSNASRETAAETQSAKAVAEDMGKTVHTVSVSAEQMSSAIGEIAESAQQARKVAMEAVTLVENATKTVSALGDSSNDIGKVVKVITVIAEQTNLLALNATIEAARAGEAGKGFAVVAHEVKELASETAKATDDISQKIQAIQSDARRAVEAILAIRAVIENVNKLSGTIAAAVEEQTAVTSEMRKTFQHVSDGTTKVVGNVTTVNKTATATAGGARDTQAAANSIATMAAQLKELVSQFKYQTRGPSGMPARVPAPPPSLARPRDSRSSRVA